MRPGPCMRGLSRALHLAAASALELEPPPAGAPRATERDRLGGGVIDLGSGVSTLLRAALWCHGGGDQLGSLHGPWT
eukprot:3374188-Rhodomonas_salina.2